MEVGIRLVIDFIYAFVARGMHIDVSEVCADTLRDRGRRDLAVQQPRAGGRHLYFICHLYLCMGENGRCGGRSWTLFLYLSVDSFLYRGISAQVIPFKLQHQQHPPTLSPFPYIHSSLLLSVSSSHLDNSIGFSVYSKWIELQRSCRNEPSRLPKCNYA